MLFRKTKWRAVAMAVLLLCAGAGPVSAQTGSAAAMAGPMRATDSPLGLMVGDYVGGNVMFLNPQTLAVQDILALPIEGHKHGPTLRTKPTGVAHMNGRFYVADERSGSILVYEMRSSSKPSGRPEKKPNRKWTLVSQFSVGVPSDIVADESEGLLFVASRADRTVYVLDENGLEVGTIGGQGSARPVTQLKGLALDRAGQRIYVSDDYASEECGSLGCSFAAAVLVYNYNGNFLGEISGNFSRAQGVAVNTNGDVYLVDSLRSQVLVFDEVSPNSWTGIGTFGSRGPGLKQLLLPMDVVVDNASSTVYVTNMMQKRVETFAFEELEALP
jgi:DNA-binding beta-propeller fold protein YncE